jgi:aspartyl-tRNA(Asn)/glutamyl-tRNA(Gln) amidotransferase subunit A
MSNTTATDLAALTIGEASALIDRGELRPSELLEAHLARIAEVEPVVHAFVEVYTEEARAEASAADVRAQRGERLGPLDGMPVSAKDLLDAAGHPTRAGSLATSERPKPADSEVIRRLRAAGATFLGKVHTHELAYGNETPPARNPWDLRRVPGGSSGGSGASVASGTSLASIGTDTGGSIRIPAALDGVVGLKPTYGRVSKEGLQPLSWSLDTAGPLARRVQDAAIVLQAIAGFDPLDPFSHDVPVDDFSEELAAEIDLAGVRIGIPESFYGPKLMPFVGDAFEAALAVFIEAGAVLVPVEMPELDRCQDVMNVLASVESASFNQVQNAERGHLYAPEVRAAMAAGQATSAITYVNAQRGRGVVRRAMHAAFEGIDTMLLPTIATQAPFVDGGGVELGDQELDVLNALNVLTIPANITGIPAITVPCGFSPDAMPIGLQLWGRPFDERRIVSVAAAYEQRTPWHTRVAPIR